LLQSILQTVDRRGEQQSASTGKIDTTLKVAYERANAGNGGQQVSNLTYQSRSARADDIRHRTCHGAKRQHF
jgi:hypothetical protein